MPEDKDIQTFGRYLRAQRMERGIELEEVSNETRIGKDMLRAIENEDHGRLPAEVYVRGFLRAYARHVGADEDMVVQSYNESILGFQQELQSERERAMMGENFWPRFLGAVGLLVLIILATVYGVSYFQKTSNSETRTALEKTPVQEQKPSITPADTPDANKPEKEQVADTGEVPPDQESSGPEGDDRKTTQSGETTEKQEAPAEAAGQAVQEESLTDSTTPAPLVLQIEAMEKTWLKAIIDDEDPKEFILHPGDNLRLEADTQYNLLIGNAGGIRLHLNDKAITVPGKSGQVVNLMLP